MFKGSITALITPFEGGKVDAPAYQRFVEWQIEQGSHGVVPCGTTGESPTLSHDEHRQVTELCVETVRGRIPVLAGCGSNSTQEAIGLTKHAQEVKCDAALQVTPYYNKPTQEGLYQHFKAIHDATNIPIVIYNIPGRSVVDMSIDTMARLAELPRIAGVKDATNDLARPLRTRVRIGPDFCQLSGEDATIGAFLGQGGHGCISVSANVAPRLCSDLHNAWMAGDFKKAFQIRDQLLPLHDAMFCETSPGPVKYAAELLGLCSAEMRLPMAPISDASKKTVKAAMEKVGLLS